MDFVFDFLIILFSIIVIYLLSVIALFINLLIVGTIIPVDTEDKLEEEILVFESFWNYLHFCRYQIIFLACVFLLGIISIMFLETYRYNTIANLLYYVATVFTFFSFSSIISLLAYFKLSGLQSYFILFGIFLILVLSLFL